MLFIPTPAEAEVDIDPAREARVALARAASRGDTGALSQLVECTSAIVWRTCAALVDRASADDLTQDTYLRAMRSIATYRGDSDPSRWLLTIARRVCAEEIARRQRHRTTVTRLRTRPVTRTTDPTTEAEIADAMTRLAPERREAFALTAVAGMSYAEAADVCGCPVGTIRSRVARARAELIEALWPQAELRECVAT
jgi:RNA polymerase sigma-70 factor (ECF subfamily)